MYTLGGHVLIVKLFEDFFEWLVLNGLKEVNHVRGLEKDGYGIFVCLFMKLFACPVLEKFLPHAVEICSV
jgi:hypothetical protein